MPDFTPVSKERHANLTWRRPSTFAFAGNDPLVALVMQEVPQAMSNMPLGFVEVEGSFTLVAIQGFKQGQNRYVAQDGRWLGDYIPAVYRTFPFKLARDKEAAEVLCIDEVAANVGAGQGEPFFLPDGVPAPAVVDAMKLLVEVEKDKVRTRKACDTLATYGLLEPWPVKAQEGEKLIDVGGLFRVAETKLYSLDPQALAAVRDGGGLVLAFAQLFSMHQLQKLAKLGNAPLAQQSGRLALTEENGVISFANL